MADARAKLLGAAGRLLRRELAPDTRIFIISGRYEYHNKGVDVFLDALAGVNEALRQSQTNVLALCAVMGGHSGVNPDAVGGDPSKISDQGPYWISSHHVYNQPQDPILNACKRLGLDNRPENHVQVIFDPALLDGNDGFLNMPYEEVLAACDLGVFPSWYEPWGYTPQESAAHAVPTVTTDLSGFGLWVRDTQGQEQGVTILHRQQTSYEGTVAALLPCRRHSSTSGARPSARYPARVRGIGFSPTIFRRIRRPWTRPWSVGRFVTRRAAHP